MKRMLGKAAAVLGGAALAGGAMLATAAPANAAWSCPKGYMCAYLNTNGVGDPGQVSGDNTNLTQYNKFKNANSMVNDGVSCNVRIYNQQNHTGAYWTVDKGYAISNLNTFSGGAFANGIHSNKWCV
ncbi:peptidase inhibitor family I36 protein [Streptomyces sp. NEAU-W12]|uniref:peptidase inhibitor family I36 protein n=1 Tax=Streptomyces sp. NEAU-W12 TaxID=2994668 RepID=UPI00224AF34C|nr:peptidase inhibitor family I36 protein [Streptomyces sp. NEAU-W12]MCX2927347.1 peptidase inhibitor family I36 protein [Streptomyces sp. NEAU-W12]